VDAEAALVLNSVKVNNRAALVSAFPDRLVIVNRDGTRTIPIRDLARITHKAGIRTGRLGIVTVDGEELIIRGLRSRDTPTAYQVLVQLAQAAQ
jgi:ABC-type hemin transport system substrate-binding protein